MKLISSSKKYLLLFLRENFPNYELIRVKTSLEGCIEEKTPTRRVIIGIICVFHDPKWIPPKRDAEHEIQSLPYTRLYR